MVLTFYFIFVVCAFDALLLLKVT